MVAQWTETKWQEIVKSDQQIKDYWLQWRSLFIRDDLITRKEKILIEKHCCIKQFYLQYVFKMYFKKSTTLEFFHSGNK